MIYIPKIVLFNSTPSHPSTETLNMINDEFEVEFSLRCYLSILAFGPEYDRIIEKTIEKGINASLNFMTKITRKCFSPFIKKLT